MTQNLNKPIPRPSMTPVIGVVARLRVDQLHNKWGRHRTMPYVRRYAELKNPLGILTLIDIIDQQLRLESSPDLAPGTPLTTPTHLQDRPQASPGTPCQAQTD